MTLVISKGITLRKGWQPMDPDAAAYITAVETADTEPLEEKTKIAIDNFVLGCKADGIWSAIKASCILAGARTLNGALVPLVGSAPTNPGSVFVSGDYNRKTGLIGDGSTKYLDSNRNNNADPQDNRHIAIYKSANGAGVNTFIGSGEQLGLGQTGIGWQSTFSRTRIWLVGGSGSGYDLAGGATGFVGGSRNISSAIVGRASSVSTEVSSTSSAPVNANIYVYRQNQAGSGGVLRYSNARLAFYSIGESLDLALLDARVTDLINAIGAAIP
jgi:hypothetical protein